MMGAGVTLNCYSNLRQHDNEVFAVGKCTVKGCVQMDHYYNASFSFKTHSDENTFLFDTQLIFIMTCLVMIGSGANVSIMSMASLYAFAAIEFMLYNINIGCLK
jgi:hypothetical protein